MKLLALVYQTLTSTFNELKKLKIGLHKEIVYEHFLHNIPIISNPSFKIDIKYLEIKNINVLHQVWKVDLKHVTERLKQGNSECYLSYCGNDLVAYHWVQSRGKHFIQQANSNIFLNEGADFMIYHTRVKDSYQGKGTNKLILAQILQDYKKKGYKRGLIYTSSKNFSNRAGIERLGFRKYSEIISLRIGKKYLPFRKLEIQ